MLLQLHSGSDGWCAVALIIWGRLCTVSDKSPTLGKKKKEKRWNPSFLQSGQKHFSALSSSCCIWHGSFNFLSMSGLSINHMLLCCSFWGVPIALMVVNIELKARALCSVMVFEGSLLQTERSYFKSSTPSMGLIWKQSGATFQGNMIYLVQINGDKRLKMPWWNGIFGQCQFDRPNDQIYTASIFLWWLIRVTQ